MEFSHFTGNFLCDAYVSVYDNVHIAFQPNEGISRFFPVGEITFEDILSGHVFANRTLDLVTMKGYYLLICCKCLCSF